jgi:hypothetical protein
MISKKFSSIPCCECGGEVIEFSVPNRLWNTVMRPDGHETDKEYICFSCWNNKLIEYISKVKKQSRKLLDTLRWVKRFYGVTPFVAKKITSVLDDLDRNLYKE